MEGVMSLLREDVHGRMWQANISILVPLQLMY